MFKHRSLLIATLLAIGMLFAALAQPAQAQVGSVLAPALTSYQYVQYYGSYYAPYVYRPYVHRPYVYRPYSSYYRYPAPYYYGPRTLPYRTYYSPYYRTPSFYFYYGW